MVHNSTNGGNVDHNIDPSMGVESNDNGNGNGTNPVAGPAIEFINENTNESNKQNDTVIIDMGVHQVSLQRQPDRWKVYMYNCLSGLSVACGVYFVIITFKSNVVSGIFLLYVFTFNFAEKIMNQRWWSHLKLPRRFRLSSIEDTTHVVS